MVSRSIIDSRKNRKDKITYIDSDNRARRSKLKGKLLSSLALMLDLPNSKDYHWSNERSFVANSIDHFRIKLRNSLSVKNDNNNDWTYNNQVLLEVKRPYEPSIILGAIRSWYPIVVKRYIQDCRVMEDKSRCKKVTWLEESRIDFVGQNVISSQRHSFDYYLNNHQNQIVNLTCSLWILKGQLDSENERISLITTSSDPTNPIHKKSQKSNVALQTESNKQCDRGVQCPANDDHLRVSSDLKFFSRSSLVINLERAAKSRSQDSLPARVRAPSLEYVANYRPEAKLDNTKTRSTSSSAIMNLRSLAGNSSSRRNITRNYQFNELHRRKSLNNRSRLETRLKRSEDDILRFTNFIEDDLTSFQHDSKFGEKLTSNLNRNNNRAIITAAAAKKILLEDYITEVKEIVRSNPRESAGESRILESVKRRIDEDVTKKTSSKSIGRSGCSDSWHSLGPNRSFSSYVTACGSSSNCHCRDGRKKSTSQQTCNNPPHRLCSFCALDQQIICLKERIETLKRCTTLRTRSETCCTIRRKKKMDQVRSGEKSSSSMDSGVLFESCSGSCKSSGDIDRFGLNRRRIEEETSSTSLNDELLSQRVERAVRRFTEKLIICERKTRERSTSRRRRRDRQRITTPRRDRKIYNIYKYLKCSRCTSEDEHIADISTPSLVSLTDTDSLPSPKI